MDDPYEVLGLPPDTDEMGVRRRYLQLVRQHPPEKEPERFAELRAAYDQLRDPLTRLESQLFNAREMDSLEDIIADVRARVRTARIPTDTLLSMAER